jgi:hypothetical protein
MSKTNRDELLWARLGCAQEDLQKAFNRTGTVLTNKPAGNSDTEMSMRCIESSIHDVLSSLDRIARYGAN